MILESLRDRHPEMFAPKPAPVVKGNGSGRTGVLAHRLGFYTRSLYALVFHKEIAAEAKRRAVLDALHAVDVEIAATGGYEAAK
jgi:hypothetical protein